MTAQKKSLPSRAMKRVAAKKAGSARVSSTVEMASLPVVIKPGSVLDRMGGLPKYMFDGDPNMSSRESRKKAVQEHVNVKATRRTMK